MIQTLPTLKTPTNQTRGSLMGRYNQHPQLHAYGQLVWEAQLLAHGQLVWEPQFQA